MTEMRYRNLGHSGLRVSVVGVGCNNFGGRASREASLQVVDAAFDEGINLFDTADAYGGRGGPGASEAILGEALVGRRDEAVVATKFGMQFGEGKFDGGGSRRWVIKAVEASLRRLQTDYIDLYQLHWPDPNTPIEETLGVLDDLVHAGKVRYVGCSNFAGWQIADADWIARERHYARFVSAENNYNLLEREIEAEVVPACERFGLGVLPYFPLAQGLLTGKYRAGEPAPQGTRLGNDPDRAQAVITEDRLARVSTLEAYAAARDVSLLHVAIGGLGAQPMVASVIAGATRSEQVHTNAAAGLWQPTSEDLAALDEIVPSGRLIPEH
jgi:aryl-alcohol dehydrogenase-like predicted oxidoreductase